MLFTYCYEFRLVVFLVLIVDLMWVLVFWYCNALIVFCLLLLIMFVLYWCI